MRRSFRAALGLVVLPMVAGGLAPVAASEAATCDLPPGILNVRDVPRGTSVESCGLVGRMISDAEGEVLVVPPPGGGVSTFALGITPADASEFAVWTTEAGEFMYAWEGDDLAPDGSTASGGPKPCDDGLYKLLGTNVLDGWEWHFNADTAPMVDGATDAIRNGVQNITGQHTDCDKFADDQVDVSAAFQGDTNRRADFDTDGSCAGYFGRDGTSVVDFGNLPAGVVARFCGWNHPLVNNLTEADFRLNKNDYDFTNNVNSGFCVDAFDVESIATHEWGHVFGMGHVGEENHGRLTMSTQAEKCSNAPRTLGWGDIGGLRYLY